MASEICFSPARTCGAMNCFISGEPIAMMGGRPMPWTRRLALMPPAPMRAISSAVTMEW